jgi:hypothetical protein
MHIRPVAWWVARKRKETWHARFFTPMLHAGVYVEHIGTSWRLCVLRVQPEFDRIVVINQTGLAHRNCKLVICLAATYSTGPTGVHSELPRKPPSTGRHLGNPSWVQVVSDSELPS